MYITGGDSYRILFLQKYSLTYRRGGSSAKILFCASKKRQEFQNSLRFFEAQKTGGGVWLLRGDWYWIFLQIRITWGWTGSVIQNSCWKRGKSFIENLRKKTSGGSSEIQIYLWTINAEYSCRVYSIRDKKQGGGDEVHVNWSVSNDYFWKSRLIRFLQFRVAQMSNA